MHSPSSLCMDAVDGERGLCVLMCAGGVEGALSAPPLPIDPISEVLFVLLPCMGANVLLSMRTERPAQHGRSRQHHSTNGHNSTSLLSLPTSASGSERRLPVLS